MRALLTLVTAVAGEPGDWRDRALCAEVDPEIFFPDKGESAALPSGSAWPVRSGPSA